MAKSYTLETKGDLRGALQGFLRQALEKGLVDAWLVPQRLPQGSNVTQSLVTSADMLKDADPLAPVMPVSSARILSAITRTKGSARKIGAVLRPCELRALVELVKLKQASLDNVLLVGLDCQGTYSVADYSRFAQENADSTAEFLKKAGQADPLLREACQICEYPYPLYADVKIGLLGADAGKAVTIEAGTPRGEEVLAGLGLAEAAADGKRTAAVADLVAAKAKKREEFFEKVLKESQGLENLLATFSKCIGCHNCRDMCPMCYCKECLFDSPTFEWEADKYLGWASRKGALRMPTDTLLFHLTRLNHMAATCVGCGLCQEACPNDIPVFGIFRTVGARVQKMFEYTPGRSPDDQLPAAGYKEAELEEAEHAHR